MPGSGMLCVRWIFMAQSACVRINQFPGGLEDLSYIVPHNIHVILIPKCERSDQVKQIDDRVKKYATNTVLIEKSFTCQSSKALWSNPGVQIATASPHIIALTIGLEDYTADIGTQRTLDGRESFWARCQVVNAQRACRRSAIDTVFSDVSDMEGLRRVSRSKILDSMAKDAFTATNSSHS